MRGKSCEIKHKDLVAKSELVTNQTEKGMVMTDQEESCLHQRYDKEYHKGWKILLGVSYKGHG